MLLARGKHPVHIFRHDFPLVVAIDSGGQLSNHLEMEHKEKLNADG